MAQIKLAEYTFDNSVGDSLPTLTPNTITMTKEDSVNGTVTRRIIYIDDTTLPTRIYFGNDKVSDKSLLTVDYLDINTNITSMEEMFSGCAKLTYVNTTNWNTTNVTNMYYAFGGTSISEINVTSFNTDKVTDMDYMFGNCSLLRFIDITNFTTRSDMSTGSMFANGNMKVIYDKSKWKSFMSLAIAKEAVTPPNHIIAKYKYDTSITSSVTKPIITDISSSSIVTKEVATGVDGIKYVIIGYDGTEQPIAKVSFYNFESLLTIDYLNFDTNIDEAKNMFQNCTNLTSINTYGWNTTTVTAMNGMFRNCSSLTSLDLSSFNTSQVANMNSMFQGCSTLTSLNLSNFNTESVNDMNYMFRNCTKLTSLDLTSFNTAKVTSSKDIFESWTSSQTVYIGKKWTIDTSSYRANFIREVIYKYMIAKYTFNNSIENCLPTITGATTSQWGYSDKVDGNITTRTIGTDEELTITNISFRDKKSLLTLDYLNFTNAITSTTHMFNKCSALTSVNALNWDTSKVTNMSYMFNNCAKLTTLDLSSWKVDNVAYMDYMFSGCNSLTSLNTSNWNTSKLTGIGYTFNGCSALTTLDLSHFKVDSVTYMDYMFQNCSSLTSLNMSNWNTSKVSKMNYMFNNCAKLTTLDLSHFKVDSVTNMSGMFRGCSVLATLKLSNWNTSKVTNMGSMFNICSSLTNLDLSHFKVDSVTSMGAMFAACSSLITLNLSNWNASKVADMSVMFQNCRKLTNLDLSHFNANSVTNMSGMFYNCASLTTLNLSNWNTSVVTNMNGMFQGCTKLTTLDLSHFNVENVTNMGNMFNTCSSLTSLNTSNWNTSKVSDMSSMFQSCVKLTSLDISSFNTSSVTNMSAMFGNCHKLTSLDLSSFNTSKVTNMNFMFRLCTSLTSLDLSNFDTSKITNTGYMLQSTALKDIGLVYCNVSTVNKIASLVPKNLECNVYYMDAEPSELTTQTNITYVPYSQSILSCSEEITLRSNGDVYDELDLLTGQVIQRIGEDNEILEEEIVRTVELDGEIGFYENSYIHTSSNEITPEFEFQPTLTNCYVVSDLKPNTQYTVLFEGNPTLMSLGGTTIENPISKIMITSGEVDNILWFDTSVSKIMILEGDLTNRDIEYFTGVKSSQKIEVQLRGNTPYFAKGGRR